MKKNTDDKQPVSRQPGETLKDKIRRHLNDKNDIITDEDIRDTLEKKKVPAKDSKEIKKAKE